MKMLEQDKENQMKEPKDATYTSKFDLTYVLEGEYYIPLVELPKPADIGIWGKRRHDYLKNHRRVIYYAMQMKETLNPLPVYSAG